MALSTRWTDSKQLFGVSKDICATLAGNTNLEAVWLFCYDPDRLAFVKSGYSARDSSDIGKDDFLPDFWPLHEDGNFASCLLDEGSTKSIQFVEDSKNCYGQRFLLVPLFALLQLASSSRASDTIFQPNGTM